MLSKKPKFKPEITRVKLNPEQAVLACTCYDNGMQAVIGTAYYENASGHVGPYCTRKGNKVKLALSVSGFGGGYQQLPNSSAANS